MISTFLFSLIPVKLFCVVNIHLKVLHMTLIEALKLFMINSFEHIIIKNLYESLCIKFLKFGFSIKISPFSWAFAVLTEVLKKLLSDEPMDHSLSINNQAYGRLLDT